MYRRDVARLATGTVLAGALPSGFVAANQDDVDGYAPLGVVPVEGTREAAVGDDGEVAYLAADTGIATVDITDPGAPELLAERRDFLEEREDGPLQAIWDVWPDGDRLLAVGPANAVPGSDLQAALLFDVADPADPELLDAHITEFPIHNCSFDDGIAYLTANQEPSRENARNPMVLLDTADDEFEEVSRWSLLDAEPAWGEIHWALRQLHDLYVQEGIAYLAYWDAGTWIVDVSDPTDPQYVADVGHFEPDELADLDNREIGAELPTPPGNAHYVQVDEAGDLLAVGQESWAIGTGDEAEGGPGGIDLYDVSDLDEIERLSTIDAPESHDNTQRGEFTTSHNFDIVGGRLYTSWYYGGVRLFDITDPSAPDELAWWREPSEAAFWTAQSAVPGEYFVASSADDVAGFDPGIDGALYVFPDRAGEQADPPDLTLPPTERNGEDGDDSFGDGDADDDADSFGDDDADDPDDDDGTDDENGDDDGDGNGGETDDESGGDAGEDGDDATDGDDADGDATGPDGGDATGGGSDGMPGFGIATTVAGLGLAGWRLTTRRDGDES